MTKRRTMSRTKIAVAFGFAVSLSAAQVLARTYNVGPNWVNQSATSCHSFSGPDEAKLERSVGEVKVTGANRWFCFARLTAAERCFTRATRPRRAGNRPYYVNIQNITVRANDTTSTDRVYCWAWGTNKNTGSTSFGASRTLCATAGGCTSGQSSYTGTNSLSLTFPFPTTPTVNYGYACSVANNSRLYYSETSITPNPERGQPHDQHENPVDPRFGARRSGRRRHG